MKCIGSTAAPSLWIVRTPGGKRGVAVSVCVGGEVDDALRLGVRRRFHNMPQRIGVAALNLLCG